MAEKAEWKQAKPIEESKNHESNASNDLHPCPSSEIRNGMYYRKEEFGCIYRF